MTDDEQQLKAQAEALVATWQPRLRLLDWDIAVHIDQPDDDGSIACSRSIWRERRVSIHIPPDVHRRQRRCREFFDDWTDLRVLEAVVLHELLHVVEHPLGGSFHHQFMAFVGDGQATAGLRTAWNDYREQWVESVARTLMALAGTLAEAA